jgi:hypothetical protein
VTHPEVVSFICGYVGVALDGHMPAYVPTDRKYRITSHADAGDDCARITDVPVGNHVLIVKSDPAHPGHVTTVSHLIIF